MSAGTTFHVIVCQNSLHFDTNKFSRIRNKSQKSVFRYRIWEIYLFIYSLVCNACIFRSAIRKKITATSAILPHWQSRAFKLDFFIKIFFLRKVGQLDCFVVQWEIDEDSSVWIIVTDDIVSLFLCCFLHYSICFVSTITSYRRVFSRDFLKSSFLIVHYCT